MNINNIMMITGGSGYDAFTQFTNQLAAGFRDYGINVIIVDYSLSDITSLKSAAVSSDLVFSFNGGVINDSGDFHDFLIANNSKCWSFLVDHPYYHSFRLNELVNDQIVSVIDRNHLKYLDCYYRDIRHTLFIPHGGTRLSDNKSFDEKKYDISFLGTYNDPEKYLPEITAMGETLTTLLTKVVDDVIECRETTVEDSLKNNLIAAGIPQYCDSIADILPELLAIDQYIRYKRRTMLIDSALKSDYEVHVFGNGWDQFKDSNNGRLVVHGPVDYMNSLNVMADSKIVLNNMPIFADGSHERIFTIMGCRSVCLTDSNVYLQENFDDGTDLLYYDWLDIDSLPEKIERIMSGIYDPDEIALNGYNKAVQNHMWKNRAKEIIDYCRSLV